MVELNKVFLLGSLLLAFGVTCSVLGVALWTLAAAGEFLLEFTQSVSLLGVVSLYSVLEIAYLGPIMWFTGIFFPSSVYSEVLRAALPFLLRVLAVVLVYVGVSNFVTGVVFLNGPSTPTGGSLRSDVARFLKNPKNGRLDSVLTVLFFPFLFEAFLVWAVRHFALLRQPKWCEVWDGVFVGRFPLSEKDLPQEIVENGVVVDITCEMPRCVGGNPILGIPGISERFTRQLLLATVAAWKAVGWLLGMGEKGGERLGGDKQIGGDKQVGKAKNRGLSYLCLPCLDGTLPPAEDLLRAVQAVRAVENAKVYVHCANGHGRSALFAAVLVQCEMLSGRGGGGVKEGVKDGVKDFDELRKIFRERRKKVGWSKAQESVAETVVQMWREANDGSGASNGTVVGAGAGTAGAAQGGTSKGGAKERRRR